MRIIPWGSWLGIVIAFAPGAFGQVQDDAALAEVPDEKPGSTSESSSPTNPSPRAWATRPREEEPPLEPPMTTAELRSAYPDVRLRATPDNSLQVLAGDIYPFQVFGVGLATDLYFSRVRVSSVATVGAALAVNDRWKPSFYAELGIGVAILRWVKQTSVGLPLRPPEYRASPRSVLGRAVLGDDRVQPTTRALVPSSHTIELEAGVFTGHYSLYRCTAACNEDPSVVPHELQDASLQTTFAYAGVRYVYFRWAASEEAHFRSLRGVQLAIDAVTNPFTPPDPTVFNIYDQHPQHHRLGARTTINVPAVRCEAQGRICVGLNLVGGYIPSPADALFMLNLVIQ